MDYSATDYLLCIMVTSSSHQTTFAPETTNYDKTRDVNREGLGISVESYGLSYRR